MSSEIARFIPEPRVHQTDRVAVATAPAETWKTVRDLDLYEARVVRGLFAMRDVPTKLSAWMHGRRAPAGPHSMKLDDIVAQPSGFHLLAEIAGSEWVCGAIGKVWEPRIPFRDDVAPADFAGFAEPGWVKVAWSIEVHPRHGGGSWVGVDVRVTATDDESWKRFTAYWALIGRFSHLIRRVVLRAVVKACGRAAPERARPLPGDEILAVAKVSWTDAITIEAPPSAVWPWLVQMGCRRAGWYSFDALDNARVPSADRIIPELQDLKVGDLLPARPSGFEGFTVLRLEREKLLALGPASLLSGESANEKEGAPYRATWAFVLEPIGDVATRLVVRVRGDFPKSARMAITKAALRPTHAIMEREQLRNLKARAERLAQS